MAYERVPLDKSYDFATSIELSSVALGGRVVSVSDEFFAEAYNLLLVEPAQSCKGQFGPKGAIYSGWESRRHNPTYDWCIIKLGAAGTIFGFDVDTSHFNGNEAPEVSVDALFSTEEQEPRVDDARWFEILPKVPLGPNSRHLFKIPETPGVNYVKLNMYPDGGIARFRVYGLVKPIFPDSETDILDLAHVLAGGRVVFTSDQHFGVGSNLILPGRGKDMGDGWETKRSRQKGHKDWAIIKLGAAGYLEQVEIDTAHFKGNFPESCEVHATNSTSLIPEDQPEDAWTLVLPRTKLGPHRRHFFQLENVHDSAFTHVRVTIYPDGGIKRVRVLGRRAKLPAASAAATTAPVTAPEPSDSASDILGAVPAVSSPSSSGPTIPAVPLTPEAFAPFGKVIMGHSDPDAVPRGTKVTSANNGTASKFHKLALLESAYPPDSGATTGISVYRCSPISAKPGGRWEVKLLERHPYTNQAFIPMGAGSALANLGGAEDSLQAPGKAYLVIVSKNGEDDKPDLKTMRAFIASAGQGIVYDTGIWHHPMAVLDTDMDFACVETQIGNGDKADCEVIDLDGSAGYHAIQIPAL
ncbi:Allantoicase [Gloeophyllum trabeum ATCC 11539]|uniref:Allantoicase n=1 Tax=Gloeophyllum trabeum (strain ATCC 11539 / FP-39264 / Madison 617) TaxID=670483 RepID=S7RVL1_GLOTA|nr:Allantoicase [Gloeophyllum trabeum ATCC 11539]EPQ57299.1 Allantoicase [Gloeophyllum trabeum ATCC 11539]